MKNNTYQVLLYYLYTEIKDPEAFRDAHLKYCQSLGILGRILVSYEGINGTVSGTIEQTNKYMADLKKDDRFKDIVFKIDEANDHAFSKMHVRFKKEIVNLGLEHDINPNQKSGKRLSPKAWYEAMQDQNTVIIDARNDYEYDLGHFKGSVRPDIQNFRDLPLWIKENKDQFKDKKILTYCTGGVRCEKFSGFLLDEGFLDVSQLEGGIATYGKDPATQGALWDGMMYVFDNRISVPINKHEHVIVGKDYFTGEPCERYINCSNPACNKQIITSEANEAKYLGACSEACRVSPRNRYVIKHQMTKEEVLKSIAQL